MKQKNSIVVRISQELPSYTNSKNEVVPERSYAAEFTDETVEEITTEKAANFLHLNVLRTLRLAELEKQDTFKLSKPVIVAMAINGKEGQMTTKLSLNYERWVKLLETAPEHIGIMFTKITNVGRLTDGEASKFVGKKDQLKEINGETHVVSRIVFTGKKTVLAPKKLKAADEKLELPAPPAEMVEAPVNNFLTEESEK